MTTGVLKWRNGRVPDALTLSVEYPGYMRIGGGGYKSAMYKVGTSGFSSFRLIRYLRELLEENPICNIT